MQFRPSQEIGRFIGTKDLQWLHSSIPHIHVTMLYLFLDGVQDKYILMRNFFLLRILGYWWRGTIESFWTGADNKLTFMLAIDNITFFKMKSTWPQLSRLKIKRIMVKGVKPEIEQYILKFCFADILEYSSFYYPYKGHNAESHTGCCIFHFVVYFLLKLLWLWKFNIILDIWNIYEIRQNTILYKV